MHRIVVFSKEGCHLCERAVSILKDLSKSHEFTLEIIEITSEESTFKKYFLKIPVIQVDGKDLLDAENLGLPAQYESKLNDLVSDLK